jgi:hypothetical protein
MRTEADPFSEIFSLEYQTTDKTQEPCNFECYTPLSEHFGTFLDVLKGFQNLTAMQLVADWFELAQDRYQLRSFIL